jgi:hypothetical protein
MERIAFLAAAERAVSLLISYVLHYENTGDVEILDGGFEKAKMLYDLLFHRFNKTLAPARYGSKRVTVILDRLISSCYS